MMLAESILGPLPTPDQTDLMLTGEVRRAICQRAEDFIAEWEADSEAVGLKKLHMIMTAMGVGVFWGLRVGE